MKKKVAAVVIMGIVGIVGLYAVGDTGVKHTIKTKQGEIEKSVSLRIRSEGVRRVVSISKEKAEELKVGFKADTGKLYLRTGESWEEDKSIEPYYEYVKYMNSEVETEGKITEIEDIGYYEGEIRRRNVTRGKKEEIEIELKEEDGIHIIVLEKGGTAKVISFRDKYRIGETTEKEIEGWIKWLKSSSKGENEKYRRISQRVYLSLTSKTPYKGLYEEEGKYLREYLGIIYGNNNKYKEIKEEEIEKAKRYVAAKITYTKENPKFKEIMEEIKSILEDKERNRLEKLIALGKLGGINNEELIESILDIKKTWKESILEIGEIVPKIEEVKAGDIVIFKEEGKEESGIVVQAEVTGEKETIKVVYMDKKRGAEEKGLSEIKEKADNKEVVIIRLIEGEKKDITNEVWNVMNDKIKDVKIEIGTMKESTQKSNEKHRWIPNTGEYLEIGNIKVTIKTEIGIEKIKENINVSFIGAEDRGYKKESGTEEGNIYNNREGKFEVKINVGEEKTYTLEKGLEKNKKEYLLYEQKSETGKTETEVSFEINRQGYLVDEKTKQKVKIKIRPEKDKINPGDDLLLKFKIGEKAYSVEAKDYIAVYDKKMLWRANQYINETEAKLQNIDWNNAHKWNTDDNKIEWNAENEWNKKYNLATDKEKTGETLINLEKGDGGQVVQFTGWTPLRKNPNVKKTENYYADRVAYDFPQMKNDKEKYINAWDSPFDFVYKMKLQREAIREKFFNESGPNMCNGRLIGKFYNEGTKNEIEGNKETISTLAFWQHTTAPNDSWRFYWKEGEKAFIPGLGLFLYDPDNPNNESNTKELTFINRKSAGTDCIGFAERTASYDGNKYKWKDLPEGWIEGVDPDSTVRYENNEFVTQYPQTGEASNIILSKEKIGKVNGVDQGTSYFTNNVGEDNNLTKNQLDSIKAQFEKVIPGDVITYKNEEDKYAHIGVITDVNYEGIEEAQSIVSIMDNIQVIESNFGSYINYVKKGMSTDGIEASYDDNTYIVGSWFYGWIDKAPPKIRNFQIERLIIEEKKQ